ncbi:uncharacterized protein LOC134742638 isoform X1 [Cydia strobilella]|uniref:uncharacterized protein LOC134742638 isoform X1 n=1 Tax=Cydia strobilella TaxID=1100964 RepID=UPI003005A9A4
MSSGNWGNRKPWGGRGRGGFGGRDRGSRGGVNKNYRGHNFGNNRGFRGGRQNDYGGRGPPQPFQNYGKTPRDMPGKRLSEEEIGVTEYINDHEGFLGVIKSRYSDFQVSEINLKGEIAKLTNTKPPQPPVDKDVEQDEDLLLNKYNVEILPMDEWDRINKLAVSEASTEKVEIDVTGMSKEQRTKIHDAVKKAFGDSIVGSTVSDGDKKLVRFERYRKGGWFPTDINPFIQVSREDIMRVQNTDFNGVSTHNPYGGAKMLSTTCIGAVSTVPYNLQGAVSTVPLFSRRDISTVTSHFTNDNRTPQGHSHSGRGVGPMVYLSSAQALSCTQSERVYETVTAICGSRLAHGSTLSDREVAGPMTFSSSAQVLYRTQLDERISGPPWKDSSAQSRTLPCIKVDRSVAWETNLSAPDVTLTDRIVGQSEASSTAKFQCHTQSIVTEDDSPEVSNALEQIEPQDNVFARLDAGWTIQDPKNKTINRVSESEPTINERKKKKNKKQRRKARELARQAIEINTTTLSTHPDGTLTDGNFAELEALPTDTSECHSQSIIIIDSDDSRAVSDVLEQTEPDAILAQLEANWTIQNPKNKTIKPVSEPAIKEIKKKKNRKQRRKARKQARRAIEMNTIALYTHLPDASGNTAYSTPNTNTMKAAIALEVSTPKGNEENPNISRKRTIEVIPPTDPIKRRKLSAKESKLEIISRKRVLVDNIDNSVEAKRQKTETIGNITYAEAVKLGLIVSITTLNRYFTPQLSEEFQQQLQARLMEDARKSNNSPGPIFRGKPIYSNGALRLWCEDEATLSWLKRTSSAITVSSGVKIIIKIKREVEPLVRCGIVLPGVWDDFTLIVKTLRYQNAWAEVDSWKLHRIEKQKTDTFAVISVPESLVKNILEHERRLGFMLGSVYVKFEGSKGFFSEYPPQNVFQNLHKGVESAHMTNQGVRIQYQTLERTDSVSDEDEEFEDHLEIEQNLRYHLDSGVNTRLSNVKKERVGMPREGIPFYQT